MGSFRNVLRAFFQWLLDWVFPTQSQTSEKPPELPEVALQRSEDENATLKAQRDTAKEADQIRNDVHGKLDGADPAIVYEPDEFERRDGS